MKKRAKPTPKTLGTGMAGRAAAAKQKAQTKRSKRGKAILSEMKKTRKY